jgi:hypothetical protein
MAKKGSGDDWWKALLLLAGGGLVLYAVKVATDEEKSGMPLPADPGGRIDFIVEKLNKRFGKGWVTVGLNALRAYLEQVLPKAVVGLVNVVYQVEQQSIYMPMNGLEKKRATLNMLQR